MYSYQNTFLQTDKGKNNYNMVSNTYSVLNICKVQNMQLPFSPGALPTTKLYLLAYTRCYQFFADYVNTNQKRGEQKERTKQKKMRPVRKKTHFVNVYVFIEHMH